MGHTGIVVSPQWPDLVLTTDIPHIELDILVGYTFDVKPNSGDGRDLLVCEFQLVKDCCFTRASASLILSIAHSEVIQFRGADLLVFPAASKPNIRIRISFVPKIFPINLET